jgi:hypothetical protein
MVKKRKSAKKKHSKTQKFSIGKITSGNLQTNSHLIYEHQIIDTVINSKNGLKGYALKVFEKFLLFYTEQNRKKSPDYPTLLIDTFVLKESNDKRYYFLNVFTKQYNNHPFTVFGSYAQKIVYIMIPIGGDIGQYDIHKIKPLIKQLPPLKKLALFHLLNITFKIRELNFNKYSKDYITCTNIIDCNDSMIILKKRGLLNSDVTTKLFNKHSNLVNRKIKIYFKLLKMSEFTLARNYLTKNDLNLKKKSKKIYTSVNSLANVKKSAIVKKNNICLKNMFYNSKSIVGHLLIFIELFKCINVIKENVIK